MKLPTSAAAWRDLLVFIAAMNVGLLVHPVVWPVVLFNPFVWTVKILTMAAQESGYNAAADNPDDNGHDTSGLLAYSEDTWSALTGRDLDDRYDPWWAGYYAAAYVQSALLASWAWWPALLVPVWSTAAYRHLWTHGASASSAGSVWSAASDETSIGNATWPAYLTWTALLGIPAALWAAVEWRAARRLAGGR